MSRYFERMELLKWFWPSFFLHTIYIAGVATASFFQKIWVEGMEGGVMVHVREKRILRIYPMHAAFYHTGSTIHILMLKIIFFRRLISTLPPSQNHLTDYNFLSYAKIRANLCPPF